MDKKIDLHIHTNFSDGVLSPKEVIDVAAKNRVSIISITDHDSVEAYNDDLYRYANINNITLINGVEISTKYKGIGIHVLGYDFDINNQELKDKLFVLRNARHKYLYDVCNKLNEAGYILNVNELDKIDSVTKGNIANDVISNDKNKKMLIKEFGHIPSKGEFIETLLNEGCPLYVEKDSITPNDAARLIRGALGKVILAHPVAYKYEDNLSTIDILEIVKDMNADGIESNYIYIDRYGKKIDEIDIWNKFAINNNLITTIGSDFHNEDGIHPSIGLIGENIDIINVDNILKK